MQPNHTEQAIASIYRINELSDLLTLNHLIIQQMRALSKRATRSFVKGQQVKFKSTKYGRMVQGSIVKVGYKNLRVLESRTNTTWRVPAALCEAA
jgi:hypothetical protein